MDPLFTDSTGSSSKLEYLGKCDGIIALDPKLLSSMTLPKADLTGLISFPDIL